MQEVSAIVVNNVVVMFAVICCTYAAMFILEKMVQLVIDAFGGIKTPSGWLKESGFTFKKLGLKKKG